MPQMFDIDVDATALLALLDRVGPSLEFHTRDVARETAVRVVAEAKSRVRRFTGRTGDEIHYDKTKDDKGYLVFGYQEGEGDYPVDIYLEYGTKFNYAHPFFFASALLENGPHMRRMAERVERVCADLGR